ncbi:MAG: hypothetical protein ABFS05_07295 [Bacteroidota bacterium]
MNSKTKLNLFVQVMLALFITQEVDAQCTNCQGTASNPQKASSAIGIRSKASGLAAFASGSDVIASGELSSSIGSKSMADGDHSVTLGSYIMSIAKGSMVIGHGFGYSSADRLFNLKPNSLMVGFNSIYPTLFVSASGDRDKTGSVGIGNVSEPEAKLHVRADPGERADLFIEQTNFREAELFLGNKGHGIRSTDGQGMVFRTERHYIFNEGFVGIGTSSPGYDLDVQGKTSTTQFRLFDKENHNDNIAGWILRSDADGNACWTNPADFNDQDWEIKEENIYRPEGNVGIGTSNPVAQLELADVYEAGGMNLKIGNDAYLSDVDLLHTLGIFSMNDPEKGAIKLGGRGPLLHGDEWKLGIGTRSPATTLEVYKDLTYGGTVGLNISNNENTRWFIGMSAKQSYLKDLLIGSFDDLSSGYSSFLVLKQDGTVGIGTNETHAYKLAVNGAILTEEVTVKVSENWPDYVFNDDYELLPLHQLENYIDCHGHLPEVPKDSEVLEDGLNLGDMERLLLKKVEELTLYIIEQENRINKIQGMIKNNSN